MDFRVAMKSGCVRTRARCMAGRSREGKLADESHTQEQAAEIADARARTAATLRPTVAALEAMLFQAFPVLDHGFVRVIDDMGDDWAIVQAARVSYGRGTKRVQEDAGLIR